MARNTLLISAAVAAAIIIGIQPTWGKVSPISNCQELQDMAKSANDNYIIIKNIDCKGFTFVPIPEFTGTLDGQNSTIENLTINAQSQAALFGTAQNATIRNLKISAATIKGGDYTATLIGNAAGVILENIEIQATISSQSYSGGVAGTISPSYFKNTDTIDRPSQLTNIVVDINLDSEKGSHTGGLAGTLEGSDLKSCRVSGSVNTNTETGYSGGVVGYLAVAEKNSDSDIRSASMAACVSEVNLSSATSSPYQSTLVGRVIGGKEHRAIIRHSIGTGILTTPNFQGSLQIGNRIGNTSVD